MAIFMYSTQGVGKLLSLMVHNRLQWGLSSSTLSTHTHIRCARETTDLQVVSYSLPDFLWLIWQGLWDTLKYSKAETVAGGREADVREPCLSLASSRSLHWRHYSRTASVTDLKQDDAKSEGIGNRSAIKMFRI